jgi:hypothetical protein
VEALVLEAVPETYKLPDKDKAVPEATPKIGVIKVGEVCRTAKPEPVVAATNKLPEAEDSTMPELKEDKVVEAVTVKVPVLVVVAKKE